MPQEQEVIVGAPGAPSRRAKAAKGPRIRKEKRRELKAEEENGGKYRRLTPLVKGRLLRSLQMSAVKVPQHPKNRRCPRGRS